MRLGAVSGPRAGAVVDVGASVTIGRSDECSVVLDDPTVSRRHARLAAAGRAVVASDEGSLNGTWVNDRRIAGPMRLSAGDRLRIGGSEFVALDPDAPPPPASHRQAGTPAQPATTVLRGLS